MLGNVHQWDTRYLSDSSSKFLIAGSHHVARMRGHSIHDAIIGVRSLVTTRQPLESRIPCHSEGDSILGTKFLQLGKNAIGDARDRLGVQAIHHALDQLDFVLQTKVDKVGIHQDSVGRTKGSIVLEEERGGCSFDVANFLFRSLLLGVCFHLVFLSGQEEGMMGWVSLSGSESSLCTIATYSR